MKCMSAAITCAFLSISYAAFIGDIFVNEDSTTMASNTGVDDGGRLLWPGGIVYYN
jgi:hypothetical protein